jgi:ketosteroid isomerase-like protein
MRNIVFLLFSFVFFSSFSQQEKTLDPIINEWHQNAANAAFDAYFGITTDDFVFLGTAPEERWSKDEFKAFCRPYFDKKSTWNFTPSSRQWNFSNDGNTAWFDERLDTWMEGCRGTGILSKIDGKWYLAYYNLHVLIENEKIKPFIELRKQP